MIAPIIHDRKALPMLSNGDVATPASIYRLFGYDSHPKIAGYARPIEYVPIILAADVYERAKGWRTSSRGKERQVLNRLTAHLYRYFNSEVGVAADDSEGRLWDDMDSLQAALAQDQSIFLSGLENTVFRDYPKLTSETVRKVCLAVLMLCELLTAQAICGAVGCRCDNTLNDCVKIIESQLVDSISGRTTVDFGNSRSHYIDTSVRIWVRTINVWVKE